MPVNLKVVVCWIAILGCIAIVFYFSWLPLPRLNLYGYLPDTLAAWTDDQANENIRTAIPLVLLGLFSGIWLFELKQSWYKWLAAWACLALIVVIAEAGQLLLPLRNFDWGDIAWGAVGALVGLLLIVITTQIWILIKSIFKSH